ncbi:MAG: putative type II secretion system protein HxcR [Phycisphaerae bacterium]|nr:putative type II secretion system protein HxcR [Phycisphaerae bacterium]
MDVVELVNELMRRAVAARASDVHFEPGPREMRVRFRVDSLLHDAETLPAAIGPNVVARLKVMAGLLTYRTDTPQEGSIPPDPAVVPFDVRVATFPTVRGERVVLRFLALRCELRALDELGFGPELVADIRGLLAQPQGLIIVCGPAGSGKTTTLCAMLSEIQRTSPASSILAIEDPVEIRLEGVTQIEVAPERGLTYGVALRSLLRQDPQVLMIGEVRDADTARLVVEAALTGHLLLTSMHSGSAVEGLVRLREMGLPAYQLTSTVQALLSQRLLRTVCARCGGGAAARGCAGCGGTGYSGRTAIGQLLTMSAGLRRALLSDADVERLSGHDPGRAALRAEARRWVERGRTTEAEVSRVLG